MSDLEKVRQGWRALEEAVKQDVRALEYVQHQTEEICLVAVKRHGYALQYVKNQTNEICLAAVRQDGYALRYVEKQTEDICLAAVKRNYHSLKYVQLSYFETAIRILRVRSLFDPVLENYIKKIEKEMQT